MLEVLKFFKKFIRHVIFYEIDILLKRRKKMSKIQLYNGLLFQYIALSFSLKKRNLRSEKSEEKINRFKMRDHEIEST